MHIFSQSGYQSLIDNIFSRHQSVQTSGFKPNAYKPGLEHMITFDKLLGLPSTGFNSIHVAGTNGKGSVCHMLAAALASTGMKVGLYTSPHLLDFRERVRIVSGSKASLIDENAVWDFLTDNENVMDELGLTFFEITTGLAFWWFAKEKVDMAIIETGLGGRLDSTNILTHPQLSIVTSIGLDHCDILGSTREEIAFEKSGIFKNGTPALVGVEDVQTRTVFEKRAASVDCKLYFADDQEGMRLYKAIGNSWIPEMDLKGEYQKINLRTVLRALKLLNYDDTEISNMKVSITESAMSTGLRGRWEKLSDKPSVIADIGHNPPALEWNFTQIKKMMSDHDRLFLIYGVMADKAVDDILPLLPSGENVSYIFTNPETPRAMDAKLIATKFRAMFPERKDICVTTSVADAIDKAIKVATDKSLIYIGGSTFVVSDAITYITSMSDSFIHP